MNAQVNDNSILFPVGRIVGGDLYTPQDKDMQGGPLTIKNGPNAGKERVNYFFAFAIPKTSGLGHWGHEPGWGQKVWALGNAMWPQGQAANNPRFAWKIEDGDSAVPNENGRKNCDREGYPGHWILKFGSSFPVKIFDEQGRPLIQPDLVKRGFYVEVLGSISSNENVQKPGIYLNHNMVAFRAPGKEIASGPDPRAVGFGKSALPSGVTSAPSSNTANLPAAAPTPYPTALVPPAGAGAPPVPVTAVSGPPVATPAAPVAVQPYPSFIAPPVAGAQPAVAAAAPPPPAAPPVAATVPAQPAVAYPDPLGAPTGYRMANPHGPRYEAFRAQLWADDQLLSAGHMVRL